jgi:hypothetical protein
LCTMQLLLRHHPHRHLHLSPPPLHTASAPLRHLQCSSRQQPLKQPGTQAHYPHLPCQVSNQMTLSRHQVLNCSSSTTSFAISSLAPSTRSPFLNVLVVPHWCNTHFYCPCLYLILVGSDPLDLHNRYRAYNRVAGMSWSSALQVCALTTFDSL